MSDDEKTARDLREQTNAMRREAMARAREESAAIRERERLQRLMIREHARLRPSKTTLL